MKDITKMDGIIRKFEKQNAELLAALKQIQLHESVTNEQWMHDILGIVEQAIKSAEK